MQKGFSNLIIVIVILLISLTAGGYYYAQKPSFIPTPQPSSQQVSTAPAVQSTPIPTSDPMADWKTYTSSKFLFSVNYPAQSVGEIIPAGEGSTDGFQITFPPDASSSLDKEKANLFIHYLKSSYKNQQEFSKNVETIVQQPGKYMTNFKIVEKSQIKVGGIVADRVVTSSDEQGKFVAVYLFNNGNEYNFALNLKTDVSGKNLQLFDQILSTFKFTDQYQPEIIKKSTSPDGSYILIHTLLGDGQAIEIQDSNGKILYKDIILENWTAINNNMKKLGLSGSGQTGFTVKNWLSNFIFTLQIALANGQTYETQVNAKTGKIIEPTFKKISGSQPINY